MNLTREQCLSEIRTCLRATETVEQGADVDPKTALQAAIGICLREVAEVMRPALPAMMLARQIIRGFTVPPK